MTVAANGKFTSPRSAELLEELRKSFVDAAEKPSFAELAEKFDMPLRTVYSRCAAERWHEQRAARIQTEEARGSALSVIAEAAKRTDFTLVRGFSDTILLGLEQLAAMIAELGENAGGLKLGTRINTLNTATFGILNLSNAAKAIGLVGFEKNLEKIGKEDNGRWDPKFLSQLNVTIQNVAAEAKAKVEPNPAADVTVE